MIELQVIDERTTRAEIEEALGHVRTTMRDCADADRRLRLARFSDALLDLWVKAPTEPAGNEAP